MPASQPFPVPRRSAQMLREDLQAAGIPYEDERGRVFDFHALRHGFVSSLAAAGVEPKVAQVLARHSTMTLTLDRYTHLRAGSERRAIAALPDLSPEREDVARATGTAGAPRRSRCERTSVSTSRSPMVRA